MAVSPSTTNRSLKRIPRVTATSLRKAGEAIYGVDGYEKIQDNLEKVLTSVTGKEMKEVCLKAAMLGRNAAVRLAPYRTGALKKGIFAARGDMTKLDALLGVNYSIAPHAHLVEFGTVKWSGHPYFRPALTETREGMAGAIVTGFKQIIDSVL